VAVVPGIGYQRAENPAMPPEQVVQTLTESLNQRWPGGGPDLLHVHNPTLAKNRHMQAVLKSLQAAGLPLLCQIHDFAEDGRPEAYFAEPYVADCHYAVVNRRDRQLLVRAGLAESGVHYLPNAITPAAWPETTTVDANAPVLYPVRAIRRKNIGEAILLRLFMPMSAPLAITLPPQSPRDLQGYRLWQTFVQHHRLPVVFEAGLRDSFQQLMGGCRYALTTSINEGFGFTFLEPWCAGKALWGRQLPDICIDFTERGVRLDHLYPHLWVPLAWIDADALCRRWCHAWRNAARQYGWQQPAGAGERGWESISAGQRIDFGLLDEPFQQAVLEQLMASSAAMETLAGLNPFLRSPGPPPSSASLIRHNREMVLRHFSPANHLERLLNIYQRVVDGSVRHAIDKQALLAAFLTPERFSLLEWSKSDG
jgi:hypothetical protein